MGLLELHKRRAQGVPDIPTGNLVSYWRFNNSLVDQAGSNVLGNFGTLAFTNGVYTGSANEAVDFIETAGYYLLKTTPIGVDFGDDSTDDPFSVVTTVNFDAFAGANEILLELGGNTASVHRRWTVALGRTGTDYFPKIWLWDFASAGSLTGQISHFSDDALAVSTNYVLTFTYDGSGLVSGIKIYVNGSEVSSYTDGSSGTFTAMDGGNQRLVFGNAAHSLTTNANAYDGRIDETGIFDIELSATQVANIYAKILAGNSLI